MIPDPSRRSLLAGSALLLSSTATSAGEAVQAPVAGLPKPSPNEPLSAKEFGAIADGYLHPLSERFATIEEARRVYPFAASLTQTLDWAAIQAAVNAIEGRTYRSVRLPAGHYVIADSIRLPNGIDFHGDGAGVTVLDNEVILLDKPQLVNAAPSFVGVAIRALSSRGGSHTLKVDVPHGEIAWLFFDGVSCAFQTNKNIECDKLLQSSNFNNCGFTHAPYGVYVAGHTTNAVNFFNCDFEQHSREHVSLHGAEGVNFYGGKFEAGGDLPNPSTDERSTIFLENAGAVNFHGVYFEGTHEILLKEVHSRGGVNFQGCHFTGAGSAKGLIPYRFVSDGLVTFGSNDWYLPSEGPAQLFQQGYNGFKLAAAGMGVETMARSTRQQRSLVGGRAVPASGLLRLATVTRVGTPAAGEQAMLTGDLVVQGAVQRAAGGTALVSRRYHLRVAAGPAGVTGQSTIASALDDSGVDLTIRLRSSGPEIAMVEAVVKGASAATLQWSLDTLCLAASGGMRLEAVLPTGG